MDMLQSYIYIVFIINIEFQNIFTNNSFVCFVVLQPVKIFIQSGFYFILFSVVPEWRMHLWWSCTLGLTLFFLLLWSRCVWWRLIVNKFDICFLIYCTVASEASWEWKGARLVKNLDTQKKEGYRANAPPPPLAPPPFRFRRLCCTK